MTFRKIPLTVVVMAVSLLAIYLVMPKVYIRSPGRPKLGISEGDIRLLLVACEQFRHDTGRYPVTEEGLSVMTNVPGIPRWHGPYLKELAKDPWGNAHRYELRDGEPVIISAGPDGLFNTEDDVTSWQVGVNH